MRRWSTAALLVGLSLAACGGDEGSDKEDVEQVVRDFADATSDSDGERFCEDLVTREFLEATTGAKGDKAEEQCVKQIEALQGADIKVIEITKTTIDGDKATVTAQLEQQGRKAEQVFRLEKEDGEFRLTGSTP